jgi:hypothetical protein
MKIVYPFLTVNGIKLERSYAISYCIRCSDPPCEGVGLISVSWNTTGSAKPVGGVCSPHAEGTAGGSTGVVFGGGSGGTGTAQGTGVNSYGSGSGSSGATGGYVPGPLNGTVTIQAYAFGPDSEGSDMWLGSKCVTKAQASQNNILKYDGKTDSYVIIPTSINSGSITGDQVEGLSLAATCNSVESVQMNLLAGSVTVTTKMGTDVGHGLQYTGFPYSVSFPDLKAYNVMGQDGCYRSGFSLNIDYPNSPAQATYSWQFVLSCGDGSGSGSSGNSSGGVGPLKS